MNQLKDAEKKASQLVSDARRARVDRMKEAKNEAEAAISAYRAEMEAEYQKALNKQNTSSGSSDSELDGKTRSDIAKLTSEFNNKKAAVEKMLCDHIVDVKVEARKARE